jgi:exopolysaccharide production protein ExoZ
VPPAWTLEFELYFYSGVALILLIAPRGRFYLALAIWLLAQAVSAALFGEPTWPVCSVLVLEFGFGCFVAWLVSQEFMKYAATSLLIGALPFAMGDILSLGPGGPSALSRVATFGIGAAFILYGCVVLERRGVFMVAPKPLVMLGDASYSLYLWHWPLICVAAFFGIGRVAVPLIFVAAFASYYLLEAPLLRVRFRLLRLTTGLQRAP